MKCNRCGRELDNDEEYCLFCGNNLKNNYKAIAKEKDNNTTKDNNKKEDNTETDNTLILAGKVFLFSIPVLIFVLFIASKSLAAAKNPSVEFFGPIPELFAVGSFLLLACIIIFIPIVIIIIGAFKGNNKKK